MKQLTVNIEEKKYAFFLELIKSMDFISIENTDIDWYETLSLSSKNNIQEGIEDIENGKIHSHDDVIKLAKKRIVGLKNSQ
jgi:predicted transcriptional regulator